MFWDGTMWSDYKGGNMGSKRGRISHSILLEKVGGNLSGGDVVEGPAVLCIGTQVTYTVTWYPPPSGYPYIWSSSDPSKVAVVDADAGTFKGVALSTVKKDDVTITVDDTMGNSASKSITVVELKRIEIIAGGSGNSDDNNSAGNAAPVCVSNAVTFTAVMTNVDIGGSGVEWSVQPPGGGGWQPQGTGKESTLTFPQTGTYEVKAECASNAVVIVVVAIKVDLKSVTFTSDHRVLTDYTNDFAGAGGTIFNPRGWTASGTNNPISHTKDNKITANVTLCVQPTGINFDLTGDGAIGALDFHKTNLNSSGSDQTIAITSDANIPAQVDVLEEIVNWSIAVSGAPTCGGDSSGAHKIYVTWGTPTGGGYTEKRISWVCTKASGATNQESCVDKLHAAVKAQTTFGSGGTDGWALLDGGSGDCDNLAKCMKYAVEMLGAGPGEERAVRASDVGGVGNCHGRCISRVIDGQTQWLVLFFPSALPGMQWNAYEGCYEVASHYYAIEPYLKGTDDYDLLRQLLGLGVEQWWVYCPNGEPGQIPDWQQGLVRVEGPIPLP